MPSNHLVGETVNSLTVTTGVILATATLTGPELYPLSAGITGSTIAVWWAKNKGESSNRTQMLLSFVTGVAAVLFVAPAFVRNVFGDLSTENRIFVYLLHGLTGSVFIDWVLDNRRKIIERAIQRAMARTVVQTYREEQSIDEKYRRDEATPEATTLPVRIHNPKASP